MAAPIAPVTRIVGLAACLAIAAVPVAAQDKQIDPKKTQQPVPGAKIPVGTNPPATKGGSSGPVTPPATMPSIKLPPPAGLPAPVFRPLGQGPAALTIPYRTTTAPLGAVGSGHEVAAAAFTPVRLRTSPLGAVGSGAAAAPPPFTPIRLRTAPLGAVGSPPGG